MKRFLWVYFGCVIMPMAFLAIGEAKASETADLVTASPAMPLAGPAENSSRETTELEVKPPSIDAEQKPDYDLTKDTARANDIETPTDDRPPQKIESITPQESLEVSDISPASAPQRVPTASIPKLDEIEIPNTNVEGLLQRAQPSFTFSQGVQISQSVVQVTGVRLNPTATGLEVILEIPDGQVLQAETRIEGKSAIADIENAQLALPSGGEFQASSPDRGIASVTVTQLEGNRLRVSVTGIKAAPTSEVVKSDRGLVLGVTPSPQENINITVTARQQTPYVIPNASSATRTDTPIRDIPQSIQAVPKR